MTALLTSTAACSSGHAARAGRAMTAAVRGCLPAGESARTTAGPYDVGRDTVTFVDHTRPTPASPARRLPALADRTLTVTLEYPVAHRAGEPGPPVDRARPADGRFPLLVFSHGVSSNGATIAALGSAWVRAGYVLAAPTFPRSSGRGADIDDLPNQPGDVRFVVSSLLAAAERPEALLHDHLATGCIAIAGHSLGAVTTLEAGYESNLRDARVRAVIAVSGELVALPGGSFSDAPTTPLLLLHGARDATVPLSGSRQAFDTLTGPRLFVTFLDADHNSLFVPPSNRLLNTAVVDFLDAELKGDPGALGALRRAVEGAPDTKLETAP